MKTLQHRFVELMPDNLEYGILYISMEYGTVIHICVCGCGNQVVTPLSPTAWKMTYDGDSVSLYPSIGNWDLPCQSHYWIEKNKIIHSAKWSRQKIKAGAAREKKRVVTFFRKQSKSKK